MIGSLYQLFSCSKMQNLDEEIENVEDDIYDECGQSEGKLSRA